MQHAHCCGLRNYNWNRKNKLIDHVFNLASAWERIVAYHLIVLKEMSERALKYDIRWSDPSFRGIRYETLDPLKYSYNEIKRLYTQGTKGRNVYSHEPSADHVFVENSIIPKAVKVHG